MGKCMVADTATRRRLSGRTVRLLIFLCILASLCLPFAYRYGFLGDNFRPVVPGTVYRSARLGPASLDRAIREHGLRTVVSLEGGDARRPWFRAEAEVCRRLQVKHVSIYFPGEDLPPPEALAELLSVFEQGQYPLLIRCKRGADRTGLAAVLYRHLHGDVPLEQAMRDELTWRTGHIDAGFGAGHMPHAFLGLYERSAAGMQVGDWIQTRYPQLYARPGQGSTGRPTSAATRHADTRRSHR